LAVAEAAVAGERGSSDASARERRVETGAVPSSFPCLFACRHTGTTKGAIAEAAGAAGGAGGRGHGNRQGADRTLRMRGGVIPPCFPPPPSSSSPSPPTSTTCSLAVLTQQRRCSVSVSRLPPPLPAPSTRRSVGAGALEECLKPTAILCRTPHTTHNSPLASEPAGLLLVVCRGGRLFLEKNMAQDRLQGRARQGASAGRGGSSSGGDCEHGKRAACGEM